MNHLILTKDELNIGEISKIVSSGSCGAISLFAGTARDSFEGRRVISLEYEAYETMALKQIELICEELRRQWPDIVNIAICHRLGLVEVREPSVVIAISSPHRKSSLQAVAVAIEELKKHVPIWKREMYINDSTWKENREFEFACNKNNFNERMCDTEDTYSLQNQLVQISVPKEEIERRIKCFVKKKRDEIDLCNVMDFTDGNIYDETKTFTNAQEGVKDEIILSCARINSAIIKQEFSKCHLKVKRVENSIGPQMRPNYLNTLDKLMVPLDIVNKESHLLEPIKQYRPIKEDRMILKYSAILERLNNIEEHIKIPRSKINNIYQRLKVVEDRILYIESISPEYHHFLVERRDVDCTNDTTPTFYEKKYSLGEIESIIHNFE